MSITWLNFHLLARYFTFLLVQKEFHLKHLFLSTRRVQLLSTSPPSRYNSTPSLQGVPVKTPFPLHQEGTPFLPIHIPSYNSNLSTLRSSRYNFSPSPPSVPVQLLSLSTKVSRYNSYHCTPGVPVTTLFSLFQVQLLSISSRSSRYKPSPPRVPVTTLHYEFP